MRRSVTRTLSFFSQWAAEVARQPWLMAVLVIGPFAILFLFGYGEGVGAPKPRTIIVTPPGQEQSPLAIDRQELNQFLDVIGTTSNEQQARQQLIDSQADLVVVVPGNPTAAIANGQHAQIQVLTDEIDPVRLSYAEAYIRQQVDALNRQTVQKSIAQAQAQVGDVNGFITQADKYLNLLKSAGDLSHAQADLTQLKSSLDNLSNTLHQALRAASNSPIFALPGLSQPLDQLQKTSQSVDDLRQRVDALQSQLGSSGAQAPSPQQLDQIQSSLAAIGKTANELKNVPADVLAAPFSLNLQNVAPWKPNGTGFYAPALLALILQHLGVTLGALSMSRVRLLGLMELFQTSPVKPVEVAIGNFLSYGTLCVLAGAALLALLLGGLGVPLFGPPAAVAGALLLLIAASVGIGLVVSMISSSEQQAAQIAMLVLIASVFFSGFLVSLDTISWPVRIISYLLPATYAIHTLDDVMLRGVFHEGADLAILGGFTIVFFCLSILLFRREFKPR